jgi:hypothetical protein
VLLRIPSPNTCADIPAGCRNTKRENEND